MKNAPLIIFLFLFFSSNSISQTKDSSHNKNYEIAYLFIKQELAGNGNFKRSVFETERAFQTTLNYSEFENLLNYKSKIVYNFFIAQSINGKKLIDSNQFLLNYSICTAIKDTITIFVSRKKINTLPFTYNFTDPFGTQDFTNTFVTKLLQTHKGNCRSLAYLYKILADELGAKCWLSLAPNHIYIKNYSQKIGWYNTELTSGTFPTDAWIMTTGYVNPEAIKSGLYMDTLSNQQAIALCVLDLAKGYERQTKNYYDGFILKCCDLVLQYHPVNPMALLLKAETLKKVYLHEKETHFPKPTVTESQMTEAYITLAKLGYREMSDMMYQKWLKSINEQKEKYSNKKVVKPSLKK